MRLKFKKGMIFCFFPKKLLENNFIVQKYSKNSNLAKRHGKYNQQELDKFEL